MFGIKKSTKRTDIAQEVMARKKRSYDWLQSNFYGEWEEAYRNYKCEKAPYLIEETKEQDLERYAMCLPDTLIAVRRFVARVTAQIPQISYRADDTTFSRPVSRTLMWQWDVGNMQPIFKRNVLQASLFGWSVIGFHWEIEEYMRRRRVQLMRENLPESDIRDVAEFYSLPPQQLLNPAFRAALVAAHGKGSTSVPIERLYQAYQGPRAGFLFVGDCFPEPDFESIQSSSWFIVERRRGTEYLDRLAKYFPETREGVAQLYKQYENGTEANKALGSSSGSSFRERLRTAINKVSGQSRTTTRAENDSARLWTITEEHSPGRHGRLRLIGENDVVVADIPYPYSLDGKIAFSETQYIPDILTGIGDSTPRLIRKLHDGHNRMFENRMNLVDRITRPLITTNDKRLFNNPNLLKRGKGFRLVLVDRPDSFQYAPEQAAIAAAASTMGQDADVQRAIQVATGESNLSMMAGVDPQQARTATGSRIMQSNLDVLSKSDMTSVTDSGIKGTVDIMFLLNASEMSDAVNFDPKKYDARWAYQAEEKWLKAHPYMFQGDGTLTVEAGSTLADDDEANVSRAHTMWDLANQRPDKLNVDTAAEQIVIAMGERARLDKWIVPPAPPPPPEPPKRSISVGIKFEMLPKEVQAQILLENGLIQPDEQADPGQPPMQGPPPEMPPPEAMNLSPAPI